jgi:outer membrane receptor for monomeric catechols
MVFPLTDGERAELFPAGITKDPSGGTAWVPPDSTPQGYMKSTSTLLVQKALALAVLSGILCAGLRAQAPTPTPTPPPPAPSTASEPVTTLEKYTVSDVPLEDQVLPTVRPVGDVMGDDRNIVDIPRSVSSVNSAWMQDRMVKNAMDFAQFSPGVYAEAQFGIPGVPYIRGDLSQVYYGGQLSLYSLNSTPPSFNGVDALDIVKGPGSAVYGPQGEGAGGYTDFVMKQPYFDAQHTEISATLGYWASGHSYSNPSLTIDNGGPISDKLAYRVSYLSRYGDGYYLNDHDQTQDGYIALTYLATSKLKIEGWTQFFEDRTNEIAGANRVSQQFIWKGTYIGGPASPVTTGPDAYYGYDIFAAPNPPAGSSPTLFDGTFSQVNPATAYTVKLPAYDALVAPGDAARSMLSQTQIKATLELAPDVTLVNRLFNYFGHSDKFEASSYSEYVPRQQSLQDRLELHDDFRVWKIDNNLITGLDFRYTGMTSYQDFQTQPFGFADLYTTVDTFFYPGYRYEGDTFGGGLQVPGGRGFSATPGNDGNQISDVYDYAAFAQDDIKLGSKLSITPGFRVDRIDATAENPAFVQVGYYNSSLEYVPLATPIYIPPGGSSPYTPGYNNSDIVTDQSFFLSINFKLNEASSFYLTYDHTEAILGTNNFGGVDGYDLPSSLSTKSTLYEFGYKESFFGNTLYFSADAFQQLKYGTQFTGPVYPIKDDGIEVDAVYQPSKQWTLNGNFTYQDATAFGSYFYQQTGNYLDYYAPSTIVDGQPGTGLGGLNFMGYVPPGGRMRAPGIPQVQANGFVEYKSPMGWGLGVGPQFIGRQDANDQGTLHIPGEIEYDGFVFYGRGHWDVRVNVKNITNKRLLDPIAVSFAGNDLIYVRPPIEASLTLRLRY